MTRFPLAFVPAALVPLALAAAPLLPSPVAPASLLAQEDPVTASLAGLDDQTSGFIVATAEMVSEDLYDYRPTPEVRTLGQILAHVANAQYFFCSSAAGEESPNSENLEETRTTKAEIVAALRDAFAYCDGVYEAMTDARGSEMVTFFGQEMARAGVLAFNTAHNYEHYGNLVTYMRLNGITPPSSM